MASSRSPLQTMARGSTHRAAVPALASRTYANGCHWCSPARPRLQWSPIFPPVWQQPSTCRQRLQLHPLQLKHRRPPSQRRTIAMPKSTFTAVIAEDEVLLRSALLEQLRATWPQLDIVAECEDGASALEAIDE